MGEDCSTARWRSKGGMAARQGVGAVGMSRELSGTSSRALGPPSALEAGKLLWGLSSHVPGDVSALMPALAGDAGELPSTKRLRGHTARLNTQRTRCQCQVPHHLQRFCSINSRLLRCTFSFSSDFSRQPEETIHPGHFFVLFTWSGPAVRNCL